MEIADEREQIAQELNVLAARFASASPAERLDLAALLADAQRRLEAHATAPAALGSASVQSPGGVEMSVATGVDATVRLRMEHVPLALAHLFTREHEPIIEVALTNRGGEDARVRVTSWLQGYSVRAVDVVVVPAASGATISQTPCVRPSRVREVHSPARAALRVRVEVLGQGIELERTLPIWLLPATTAWLIVGEPDTGRSRRLTHYLPAWVTPNQPAVLELLRDAAAHHTMVGYLAKADVLAEDVRAQVEAIWRAAKARDIRYVVSSAFAYGGTHARVTQRLRLPRETLETQLANCLDGVVLLASVVEAAGLRPVIVTAPGHAFLAYRLARTGEALDYVETTMLATADFAAASAQGRALAARFGSALGHHDVVALRASHGILPCE